MSFIIRVPSRFCIDIKKNNLQKGTNITIQSKSATLGAFLNFEVDVAEVLNIEPKDFYKHLRVELGDTLNKGDVIAEKSGWLHTLVVRSPAKGEVRAIDHTTGIVSLSSQNEIKKSILVEGIFEGVKGGDILLKVESGIELEVDFPIDSSFSGECAYCKRSSDVTIQNCKSRVIVTSFSDSIRTAKISAFDPLAIISTSLTYYSSEVPQLRISDNKAKNELFNRHYSFAVYFDGGRVVYLYNLKKNGK